MFAFVGRMPSKHWLAVSLEFAWLKTSLLKYTKEFGEFNVLTKHGSAVINVQA